LGLVVFGELLPGLIEGLIQHCQSVASHRTNLDECIGANGTIPLVLLLLLSAAPKRSLVGSPCHAGSRFFLHRPRCIRRLEVENASFSTTGR
jgi:hypothetical protein